MEVPIDKLIPGGVYIRRRRANNAFEGKKVFLGISGEGFARFDAGNGNIISDNPAAYKFILPPVSPTAVKKIAEDKNLPEDIERYIKKFGGKKTRKQRRRHAKKKTSHRRR